MEVSDALRRHFEQEAQAMIRQGSRDANSAAGDKACGLSAWVWRGTEGTRGVQHSSVDVHLPSNLSEERAELVLRVDIPPGFDPQHIPAQVDCFQFSMPISVRNYRERVDAKGLSCQAAWETRNGTAGAKGLRQAAAAQHAVTDGVDSHLRIILSCTEDSRVDVEIGLSDGNGCAALDTAFEVVDTTLPAMAGQKLTVGVRIKSVDSKLVLQLKVGGGHETKSWVCSELLEIELFKVMGSTLNVCTV